jgi:hypothetical protein
MKKVLSCLASKTGLLLRPKTSFLEPVSDLGDPCCSDGGSPARMAGAAVPSGLGLIIR